MQFQLQDIFRAANPSLDLSETKSDFKSNNWILCAMHMFQSVSRTCNHNIIHANMTDRECGIRCTAAEWGFHNTWIFVQISLSVCCMSFWVFFYWGGWGRIFISLPLRHDSSEWTEERKLCLARKWWIQHWKMNGVRQLASFFRMQKSIGSGTTT